MGDPPRGRVSRPCPACHAPHVLAADGACPRCRGLWTGAGRLEGLAAGLPALARRTAGRGPLTSLNCPDCRFALKSFDVPGPVYEGDLFWGLETARPSGTCVAEGCARCGGVWVDAGNLGRAGGAAGFLANLAGFLGG